MSQPDSFVDEVTDELRRDKLFAAFRKYGWIGVVVVVAIVGGAAWNEWQKAQAETRAEAFGDAALTALETQETAARMAALAAVPTDGDQKALQGLLLSGNPDEDRAGSLAALDALIADATQPQVYRDLAVLRRVAIVGAEQPLADRRTALQGVAVPGRPFRTLAEEQLAYLLIEEGKKDEALAALLALVQDQEAPKGQRSRLGMVITALGGTVPAAVPTDAG